MTAPVGPYCTSEDVAAFLLNLAPSGDFSTNTTPTKAAVESLIGMYSGWIEARFASIGYFVPWVELDGESWPDFQGAILKLMNALGAAGAISGPVLKPAPAIGGKRGQADNVLTADFKQFLEQVSVDGHGIRAKYRVGSKAERFVHDPIGPLTDYLLGYFDATNWQTTFEYTAMVESVRNDFVVGLGTNPWDNMLSRRRTLVGV